MALAAAAVIVSAAVALPACSSGSAAKSGSAASGPTTAAPTTAAPLVGPPVKVMQIYDGSGPAATPEVTEGAQAAVKALNAYGGIGHHPVALVECNTDNDPNTAANCGRTAVAGDVVALVGSSTQYASEFLPDMVAHKIADLGAEPAGVGDFTSPAS
ncbi:MAG TPA: ABC transporter substrate-binding protein, partial [Acidimicrobiales bacterium]|nr:ABC transporter substrate-binding protein [Acidimicrobiales bacterium]